MRSLVSDSNSTSWFRWLLGSPSRALSSTVNPVTLVAETLSSDMTTYEDLWELFLGVFVRFDLSVSRHIICQTSLLWQDFLGVHLVNMVSISSISMGNLVQSDIDLLPLAGIFGNIHRRKRCLSIRQASDVFRYNHNVLDLLLFYIYFETVLIPKSPPGHESQVWDPEIPRAKIYWDQGDKCLLHYFFVSHSGFF